jgi:histone H3/H4
MVEKNGNDVHLGVQTIKEIGYESTKNERISKDAAIRIALEEEDRIQEIMRLAEVIAIRAGRKTVSEKDVRIVYQMMESDLS